MDTTDAFSRIWTAFEACETLPACAWCGRVRIDETWQVPPPAALATIDERHALTHTICPLCVASVQRSTAVLRISNR